MTKKFTGRSGKLRVYDSSDIVALGNAANMNVEVFDDSGGSFTDKTTEASVDDTSYTGSFWVDSPDLIYVGCTAKFARIKVLIGGGVAAVGAGALIAKYYNGSTWVALTVTDGTAVGGHTLKQDGVIYFSIPGDWALQGNANLDAAKYYIQLSPTAYPSTEPSLDMLAPVDGQFYEIPFVNMDFNGPIGRPSTEEQIVLNRGTMDPYAHYVEQGDETIFAPQEIGWSCLIDDTHNKTVVQTALTGGDPDATYWGETGVTAKGTTKNDGTNYNPAFADANKKAINVQVLWDGATDLGDAYYEVFFPDDQITLTESDDGVVMNVKGAVFGVIERIAGFGVRY